MSNNIECAFFGVLGRDGEAKTSKAGKPYLRLNVRVGDGNSAVWVGVTAFDTKAIEAAAKMVQGARVYCEGSLRLDEWKAQDGSANTVSQSCPDTVACRRSAATSRAGNAMTPGSVRR